MTQEKLKNFPTHSPPTQAHNWIVKEGNLLTGRAEIESSKPPASVKVSYAKFRPHPWPEIESDTTVRRAESRDAPTLKAFLFSYDRLKDSPPPETCNPRHCAPTRTDRSGHSACGSRGSGSGTRAVRPRCSPASACHHSWPPYRSRP